MDNQESRVDSLKFSLVILTYNRADTVAKAVRHNLAVAGFPIHEIIWVDNGSTDHIYSVMQQFNPDVKILNKTNLGVAKGYNRGIALATGTHIVITGCDRFMPDNWLGTFAKYVKALPQTGVISCYSKDLSQAPERLRGSITETINGLPFIPAMPMEARCMTRNFHKKVGFLREDFGLYGWEDVEWAYRAERVASELRLINYVIPDMKATHIGSEGNADYNGVDNKDYYEMKKREAADPRKAEIMRNCQAMNYPYYNPYL